MLLLELVVLIALVASLGAVARVWLSAWGAFLLAVVIVGIVVPLALYWRLVPVGRVATPIAATLVLVGGFLLRVVLVLASETVRLSWAPRVLVARRARRRHGRVRQPGGHAEPRCRPRCRSRQPRRGRQDARRLGAVLPDAADHALRRAATRPGPSGQGGGSR